MTEDAPMTFWSCDAALKNTISVIMLSSSNQFVEINTSV